MKNATNLHYSTQYDVLPHDIEITDYCDVTSPILLSSYLLADLTVLCAYVLDILTPTINHSTTKVDKFELSTTLYNSCTYKSVLRDL